MRRVLAADQRPLLHWRLWSLRLGLHLNILDEVVNNLLALVLVLVDRGLLDRLRLLRLSYGVLDVLTWILAATNASELLNWCRVVYVGVDG